MTQREHLSLYKLQTVIKDRLQEAMPYTFWVSAEISEMKINRSGHCYLELVEKGGANQIPRAKASAVIWRSTFGAVESYFRSATGVELAEGMSVLLKASVSYHELYGLSLNVTDIDPLYTLGDMERQRQETIRRLEQEGVFDMNRALEIPVLVQRVAVISSAGAAGYRDFMQELAAYDYRFHTMLFEAVMQGHEAEDSLVSALERVAGAADDFDAVVIIRGGGAQSDLAAFDSYRLSAHIAQFPLPVVTGIGHDKDQSVADLVAAVALKTPTAVASWLVGMAAEMEGWLDDARQELLQRSVVLLEEERRRLRDAGFALSRAATAMTRSVELRLERLLGEVRRRQADVMADCRRELSTASSALAERAAARLATENSRLEIAERIVHGSAPERILNLGFAIVRSQGRAMRDSAGVEPGRRLDITLAQGSLTAEVTGEGGE